MRGSGRETEQKATRRNPFCGRDALFASSMRIQSHPEGAAAATDGLPFVHWLGVRGSNVEMVEMSSVARWSRPITTDESAIYWFSNNSSLRISM